METPEATKRQAAFLATFQCHKRVQAGRIVALDLHPGQMWVKVEAKPPELFVVFPVDATMLVRFDPHPGDYAVVYDDGYLAFSPREVFEDGYRRWPDPSLPLSTDPVPLIALAYPEAFNAGVLHERERAARAIGAAEATYRADAELSPATEYHDTVRAGPVALDQRPAFAKGERFASTCIAIDDNGVAWWIKPHAGTVAKVAL